MFSINTYNALDIATLLARHYGERIVSYDELFEYCFATKETLVFLLKTLEDIRIIAQPHGEGNGYTLIKRPDEVKILEIVEPFDKNIFYDHFFNREGVLISERAKRFYMDNRPIQQVLTKRLKNQTLSKWCHKVSNQFPYGFE